MQKIAAISQLLTLVVLSAFSGALLFIAFVLVKFWQSIAPDVFLSWMSEHFFRLPTIMVPLNVLSLLSAIAALTTSWKVFPKSRLPFGLGLLSLIVCTLTFPIYFADANAKFVTQSIDFVDVDRQITTWLNWHWFRTGLAILSVVFVSWGLFEQKQTSALVETNS
jgi:hypothetical protein